MLRNVLMVLSVIVIVWWMRDGDPRALRRDLLAFTADVTSFDDRDTGNDWGG